MNRLDTATRTRILHCLVEGNSVRATARLTGTTKRTVTNLLIDAGRACADYHDQSVRGVQSKRVQVDEIWSFTYAKQKNVPFAKSAPEGAGDTWTWTAICADSKLCINWLVGARDAEYAREFLTDTYDRLANRVQLTSDGHLVYLGAVRDAFGIDVDYAMLVKEYGQAPDGPQTRYSPPVCTGAVKKPIHGRPDPKHISTSFVERQNLTMRMHMRRFTRLTNAFSKKVENHAYAVALHFTFYNFCRIHKSLRVTPAMAAGLCDRVWDIADIVALVEKIENAAPSTKRGPYKKKAA
ncbi:transposase [Candidatus Viadribacter manganicus]|uniref:Transposase n=1 Tax=Candidatus Viadribacter manganicus TaxID=1759059 RepID=A0A1B1AKR8_9PROT|nr:transposase [Candidatus Viadribacter manganicus]ANP47120.1 transposase [Candidatus Viadribacter manganicus]